MSTGRKGLHGVSAELKEQLIRKTLERRLRKAAEKPASAATGSRAGHRPVPEVFTRFALHPGYQQVRILREGAQRLGIANPYYRAHDGLASARTLIEGREFLNFSSYDYLGLCGDPRVSMAAKVAIERYGTSVSASRLVSGERAVHRELERALADAYGVDEAIVFVSGHATNVSTIGALLGPKDLALHDAFAHNSIIQGIELSGARRLPFAHNDVTALEALLERERHQYERVLIALEGIYSMDGDYPDLPAFVDVKRRYGAFLMVDEAHSFGVMGRRGLGIREHFNIAGTDVDIWMGTLSKTLAGCGGYIAGEGALIDILKASAGGFVYSVGMSPPLAAASRAALECMLAEPERVAALQARGGEFLRLARAAGVNVGMSSGLAVIPAITGSSIRAARLAEALHRRAVNVQPIVYPAVADDSARLRFFVSCRHAEEDIRHAVAVLAEELDAL
jgi:8-amino-7-oxononanoate synthase